MMNPRDPSAWTSRMQVSNPHELVKDRGTALSDFVQVMNTSKRAVGG